MHQRLFEVVLFARVNVRLALLCRFVGLKANFFDTPRSRNLQFTCHVHGAAPLYDTGSAYFVSSTQPESAGHRKHAIDSCLKVDTGCAWLSLVVPTYISDI